MKRFFKSLILAVLTVACAFTAFACNDGDQTNGEKGIICKKLTGEDFYTVYDYVPENAETTSLDVAKAVKEKYGEDAVVGRINANSFEGDDTLLEIIVPDTVTEIRAGAFDKMRNLQKITLPFIGRTPNADSFIGETGEASNKSIDDEKTFAYIFGTEEYTYGAKITVSCGIEGTSEDGSTSTQTTDYYIPSSLSVVTIAPKEAGYKIPAYAFNGVNQITEVKLTSNVEVIGINAFENAKSLNKINLPASITTVRENAFLNAINLQTVVIEQRETTNFISVGAGAFKGCESLNADAIKEAFKETERDLAFDN